MALVVTSTVLAIHAVAEGDRRDTDDTKLSTLPQGDPSKPALQSSFNSHDNAAKSSRTAALVVGTVGCLAVAGAVVLWFVEGGSSSSASGAPASAKAGAKPSIVPSLSPGYAGASFGASF